MPAIHRLGDMTTGHCFNPVAAQEGAPTTYMNGKAIILVGAKYPPHSCGPSTHQGVLAKGSPTYYCGGKAVGRVGDNLSCGDKVGMGSPTGFSG